METSIPLDPTVRVFDLWRQSNAAGLSLYLAPHPRQSANAGWNVLVRDSRNPLAGAQLGASEDAAIASHHPRFDFFVIYCFLVFRVTSPLQSKPNYPPSKPVRPHKVQFNCGEIITRRFDFNNKNMRFPASFLNRKIRRRFSSSNKRCRNRVQQKQ